MQAVMYNNYYDTRLYCSVKNEGYYYFQIIKNVEYYNIREK